MRRRVAGTAGAGYGPGALLLLGLVALFVAERLWLQDAARAVALTAGGLACVAALTLRGLSAAQRQGGARTIERFLLGGQVAVLVAVGAHWLVGQGAPDMQAQPAQGGHLLRFVGPAAWALLLPALWAAEAAYVRMGPPATGSEPRGVYAAAQRGLAWGLLLVSAVCLNYVASRRDLRVDVSYFRTTLPSAGTERAVASLDGDLRVVLFYRRDSDVLPRVRGYFEALEQGTAKRLAIEVVDHDFVPELSRTYRVRSNGHVLLLWSPAGSPSDPSVQAPGAQPTEKGHPFRIGEGLASARANLRELDAHFLGALRELTQPEQRVLMTVGHGERNQSRDRQRGSEVTTLRKVLARLHLSTAELGLASGLAAGVPEDAAAVIVLGPREPFLPEEVASLVRFVRTGGRLFLMLDPDVDVGLEPLLQAAGVQRLPGKVASERSHMRRSNTRMDRLLVFSNRYGAHPVVSTARRYADEVTTVFFGAAGFAEAPPGPGPKPRVSFPLRGGDDFFRDRDGDYVRDGDEPAEAVGLIAAAEVAQERNEGNEGKGRPGRVVVVGDGDFVTDQLARNNGNLMVFIDGLSWLVESPAMVADVASEADVRIEHSQGRERLWFYATTVLAPLPIALLGFAQLRRRRGGVAP